jgi:hypothetical protein
MNAMMSPKGYMCTADAAGPRRGFGSGFCALIPTGEGAPSGTDSSAGRTLAALAPTSPMRLPKSWGGALRPATGGSNWACCSSSNCGDRSHVRKRWCDREEARSVAFVNSQTRRKDFRRASEISCVVCVGGGLRKEGGGKWGYDEQHEPIHEPGGLCGQERTACLSSLALAPTPHFTCGITKVPRCTEYCDRCFGNARRLANWVQVGAQLPLAVHTPEGRSC